MSSAVRSFLSAGAMLILNSTLCTCQNLVLTAKVANKTVSVGSPIRVDVTLKNDSTTDIRIRRIPNDGQADLSFTFNLSRNVGLPVEETELSKLHKSDHMMIISRAIKTLKPGDAVSEWADISALFILKPGTYTLTVSRAPKGFETFTTVVSPPLQITVTP